MGKSALTLEVLIGAKTDSSYNSALNKAMKDMGKFGKTANRALKFVNKGFVATQIGKVVGDAIKTYGEFEQSMANTGAIANATASEYEKMWDAARYAGRTTTMTAKESADALGYMSLAGWDVNSSTRALLPVLRLAEATGKDLQTTSDLVTDSMGALQLGVEDLDVYMDKLVKTNNRANTSAEQLMQSIIKSGGAMRNVGAETDELITAIGILANNGVKGTEAGTAMNAILTRISANPQAKKGLKEIGVDLFDMNGQFIGIENSLKKLNEAYSGLTDEERSHVSRLIGGIQYGTKLKYLIDSVAEGADGSASKWSKLESAIGDSAGSLDEMNKRATSTIPAAAERVRSAFKDAQIGAVDVFGDDIRVFLDDIAQAIPPLADSLASFLQDNRGTILEFGEMLTGAGSTAGNALLDTMKFMVDHQAVIGGLIGGKIGLGLVQGVGSVATAITEAGGVIPALTQALGAGGPVGLGIAGAAVGIGAIAAHVHQLREDAKDSSLEEHFGTISMTLGEIQDTASQIVNMGEMTAYTREVEELDSITKDIDRNVSAINKANWKMSLGLELTDAEMSDYQSNIEGYIQGVNDYVAQKGFTTNVALDNLFGDSAAGNYYKNAADNYYSGVSAEMTKVGSELSNLVKSAFEDGLMDDSEEKAIRKKMAELQSIQNEIQQQEQQNKMDILTAQYAGSLDAESYRQLIGEVQKQQAEKNALIDQETQSAITPEDSVAARNQKLEQGNYKKAEAYGESAKEAVGVFYNAYSDEMLKGSKNLEKEYQTILDDFLNGSMNGDYAQTFRNMSEQLTNVQSKLDPGDRMAMQSIYEEYLPMRNEMQQLADQMRQSGQEVPESLIEGINSIDMVGAVSGSGTAMWDAIAISILNSPEKLAAYNSAKNAGAEIPPELSNAIANNVGVVQGGVNTLQRQTQGYLDAMPNFQVNKLVQVHLTPVYDGMSTAGWSQLGGVHVAGKQAKLDQMDTKKTQHKKKALGGIVPSKILTTFAENNPEAAIPLDGSSRAKGLWQRTGKLLGMGSAMQDTTEQVQTTNVTFAPTINISGKADAQEVKRGVTAGFEEFRAMMKRYERETNRRSFAR